MLDVASSRVEDSERESSAMSKMPNTEVQLSKWTPERPGIDQPAKQTLDPGRQPLPGTAFPQRLRIMQITLGKV